MALYDNVTSAKPNLRRNTRFLHNVRGAAHVFRESFDLMAAFGAYHRFLVSDAYCKALRAHLAGCPDLDSLKRTLLDLGGSVRLKAKQRGLKTPPGTWGKFVRRVSSVCHLPS